MNEGHAKDLLAAGGDEDGADGGDSYGRQEGGAAALVRAKLGPDEGEESEADGEVEPWAVVAGVGDVGYWAEVGHGEIQTGNGTAVLGFQGFLSSNK